jgi:hypothetical protein
MKVSQQLELLTGSRPSIQKPDSNCWLVFPVMDELCLTVVHMYSFGCFADGPPAARYSSKRL